MGELLKVDSIFTDVFVDNKNKAFEFIADKAIDLNITDYKEGYMDSILQREKLLSTNMGSGIAIPHCKSIFVKKLSVMLIKLNHLIDWNAGEEGVDIIINLAVPEQNASSNHLHMLANIARRLANEQFVKELKRTNSKEDLFNLFL